MRNRVSSAVIGLLVSSVISGTAQATVYSGRVNEALVQSNSTGRTVSTQSQAASVSYSTLTRAYTLTDVAGHAYTLSPGELVTAQSTASYAVYRDTASGLTFKILKNGSGNPLINLTYVRFANWSKSVAPGAGYTSATQEDWVVFGQQTALSGMPRSGSATYSAILDGRYSDGSGLYRVSGNGGLTANFLGGTMNMFINPIITNQTTNASSHLGSMSGTGTISGGVLSGSDQSPDYNFSYAGNFYGLAAQEVGGTFFMNVGTGGGSGVFVGGQGALPAMDPAAAPPPPPPPPPAGLTGRQMELNAASKSGALVSAGTNSMSVSVGYDATTQTYVLREIGSTQSYALTPAEIDTARSNDQFTVYGDGETGVTVNAEQGERQQPHRPDLCQLCRLEPFDDASDRCGLSDPNRLCRVR